MWLKLTFLGMDVPLADVLDENTSLALLSLHRLRLRRLLEELLDDMLRLRVLRHERVGSVVTRLISPAADLEKVDACSCTREFLGRPRRHRPMPAALASRCRTRGLRAIRNDEREGKIGVSRKSVSPADSSSSLDSLDDE